MLRLRGPKLGSAECCSIAALLVMGACVLGEPGPDVQDTGNDAVTDGGQANEPDALASDGGKPPPRPEGGVKDAATARLDAGARDASAGLDASASVSDATAPHEAAVAPHERDAAHEDAGVTGPSAVDAATGCTLDGTFAAEVTFDADWKGTNLAGIVPLLKAGSGALRVHVRLDMRGGTGLSRSVVTVCSAIMPEFAAGNAIVGTEQYSPYFLDSSWEQPTMPRWDLGWDFRCTEPGCSFTTEALLVTLGARAPGSEGWPGRTGPVTQIRGVDHDQDGRPGLAILSRGPDQRNAQGTPYSELPVTWTLGARATEVDLALQLEVQLDGTVADCNTLSAAIRQGRVEARALGCLARSSTNSPAFMCNEEQRAFVDENIPTWSVRGGSARVLRVASDADCSAVRTIFE